jgi:hypothetical protein
MIPRVRRYPLRPTTRRRLTPIPRLIEVPPLHERIPNSDVQWWANHIGKTVIRQTSHGLMHCYITQIDHETLLYPYDAIVTLTPTGKPIDW